MQLHPAWATSADIPIDNSEVRARERKTNRRIQKNIKTAKNHRSYTDFRDKSSCYLTSIEARGQDKDFYCFLSKMDASSIDPTHKTDPPDPVEDNACKEDLKPTNETGTISNTVSTSENIDNNEGNIVESVEHEGDADDTEHSSSSDTEHSSSSDTEHSSSSDTEHSSSSDSEHSERDFVYEGGFFVDHKKLYEEALYKLSELCKDQTTTGVVNEEQEIAINALEDKLREKEVELTTLRNSSLTDKRSLDKDDNKGCTPIPVSPITMSINSSVHHVLVLYTTTAQGYLFTKYSTL